MSTKGEVDMPELRDQIIRLLDERGHRRSKKIATTGEIAEALNVPLRKVMVSLRSSEAMGIVKFLGRGGMTEDRWPVMLTDHAYIYLEANLNA